MTAIRYAATFRAEVSAELRYALDRGEQEWAIRLTEDIFELERLLARFPDAGREIVREGATSLRKMKLRRRPFVTWYSTDPTAEQVVLIRLFHARQQRPEPRLR